MSASSYAASGATSLGLSTTVQPAASARRDLGDDLVQRVVPRRDRADHAGGLAHDERVADALPAEVVAREELDVAAKDSQRRADLHPARERDRRPMSDVIAAATAAERSSSRSAAASR